MKAIYFNGRALRVVLAAALAAASGAFAVNSHALGPQEDTANLTVSATVNASCTVSTAAVAFGNYDPIVSNKSVALNGQGSVTTICTNGSAAKITLSQGANAASGSSDAMPLRQMASGADRLPYFLYQDTGGTSVWGNTPATAKSDTGTGVASTQTVYGQIPANQFKPVGSYADTVVATVSF
jgi:spore coat protein U-like protein